MDNNDEVIKIFNQMEDPFALGYDVLPKTKEELDTFLRFYFGVCLASQPIEEGNSSPLDFAWDVISSMMGFKAVPKLEDFNFLGIACRSGQKSLSCGAIEAFALKFDKWRDYFHMASIYEQSKVTYGYVQDILNKPYANTTAVKSVMSETVARTGRKLKLGTGTMRAVNSFHGSVIQDEVDLTEKRVFVESKGMLSPSMGRSPLNVCISTRKFAFGNIQEMINIKTKKPDYPLKVHKWGVLEITSRCDDRRSGLQNKELYVNEEDLVALTPEEYIKLSKAARVNYASYPAYEHCKSCGIFSFCLGRLKKQKEDNPFLQPIDDLRRLFFTDDIEFFKSQRLNRKPSKIGLVYPDVESDIHFATYERMYELFLREEYKGSEDEDLDLAQMIAVFKKHNCKVFVGTDFGFNDSVALLGAVDGQDNIFILAEIYCKFKSDAEFAYEVNAKWGELGVDRVFPDIEDPGAIKEFKKFFAVVDAETQPYSKISKDPRWGIGLVRRHMRLPGSNRVSKLFIHNSCEKTIDEVIVYRLKLDPELDEPSEKIHKKKDHAMDAMRYLVVGILGMYKVGYILIDETRPMGITPKEGGNGNGNGAKHIPDVQKVIEQMGSMEFVDNSSEFSVVGGKVVEKSESKLTSKVRFTLA